MEGRVDLSALERSRMLSQLSSGALGHLRGSSSFSEAESMSQMASDSDRSRGVSPSALHFLPSAGLHPSGKYTCIVGFPFTQESVDFIVLTFVAFSTILVGFGFVSCLFSSSITYTCISVAM